MDKKFLHSPLKATGERVWRTYTGGRNLDKLSGKTTCEDSQFPELWLLSTVQAKNVGREDIIEGLCFVTIGEEKHSLKDIITNYPNEMLGKEYNESFDGGMGVLAKIIDSEERLTIQVHPTKEKARQYFNSEYGKTESWHILETREDAQEEPCMYMGFKEGVTKEEFAKAFKDQDLEGLLSCLHRIPVTKGETYIVHGGLPHAIGAGCTLIEIQEPTDYTLRVEKTTPAGFKIDDMACHQGLGVEKMLDCFDYTTETLEEVISRCRLPEKPTEIDDNSIISMVDYGVTPCFRMEKILVNSSLTLESDETFYGLYVSEGNGEITTANGTSEINRNDQYFVSTICEPFTVKATNGPVEIIRFYGQQI